VVRRTPQEGDVYRVTVSVGTTLGQFLQVAGIASTGGQAKALVQEGAVTVEGEVETRRGHRLSDGLLVEVGGRRFRVVERKGKLGTAETGGSVED
jgi:ribosome-associated protein